MRPIRLEMEGFTSFRDRTVVDFEDADLFVLTGPTGAGKSSVIDAITFALYGSIPRLGEKAVAPVISRGMLQASVRLDFAVGDDRYTAVRVARAIKTGATTAEARLEDIDGNTLAGSERVLSSKVEGILGLSFDHFTKSVVLPQGDFADLLHETAGERQKMLRKLLGAELFSRLAQRAGQRRTTSEAQANTLSDQIQQLKDDGITADGLKAARERASDLDSLVKCVEAQQLEIVCLLEEIRSAKRDSATIEARLRLLKAVRIPEDVPELAGKLAEGKRALCDANEAHGDAMEERQCRQDALGKLPNEAELSLVLQRYDDLAEARKERDEAASHLCEAKKVLEDAQAVVCQAKEALDAAERAKRSIEDKHRAYHLAQGLEQGGACPVCRQHVIEPPDMETPAGMHEAETALQTAKNDHECANAKLKTAQTAVDGRKQSFTDWGGRVEDLEDKLKDAPARKDVKASLKEVEAASCALREANDKENKALKRLTKAEQVVNDLEGDEKRAWQDYDTQRDRLAEMQPPAANREDLAAAWNDLDAWSKEQAKNQCALHEKAEDKLDAMESALGKLRAGIAKWCSEAGVVVADGEEPLTVCSREQGKQEGEVKRIKLALKDLNRKRGDLELRRKEAAVAADLARRLGSRYFEQWLMSQVLAQLCIGASRELLRLSSDSYSLVLDGSNNFEVVDHTNADELRPVKTLSGGETFLASLSLALSLSEHLADLAVGGAAKLEALFLDEGFGTLDSDTLDVVISAIEELGSSGRMVGVVTHVKELAESIPVRYEVTKQGNRSSIERVEA